MGEGERSLGKCTLALLILCVILLMGGLIAGIIYGIHRDDIGLDKNRHGTAIPPDPETTAPPTTPFGAAWARVSPDDIPWDSGYGEYRFAGVAVTDGRCSRIATEMMAHHGASPVDAAIAAQFCAGVVNPAVTGVGAGGFINIYDRPSNASKTSPRQSVFINFREVAPLAATEDMFTRPGAPSSSRGGMAIAVPGQVKGYYEAWTRFGRLPWAYLLQPSIQLARGGFQIAGDLGDFIENRKQVFLGIPEMRDFFTRDGEALKEGDTITRPRYAATLQKIADNPMAFYDPNDQLAQDIAADIQDAGGIITVEDLANYKVSIEEPLKIPFAGGAFTLVTPQPPSSGVIVGLILRILSEFEWDGTEIDTIDKAVLTYQRLTEAFKLSFAQRSKLGDSNFVDNTQLLETLLSDGTAEELKNRINESFTQPLEYYQPEHLDVNDAGTNQLSLMGGNGSAVSMATTNNYDFGSMVLGNRTGILFNNQMDDFGKPGRDDFWGLPASPANLIEPGKRPMSSMSPSIVLNNKGEVVLVTGATGGSRMITTIVQGIMKSLWLGWNPKEAVDDPRIHHQLVPEYIRVETGINQAVLDGLISKGHEIQNIDPQSVYQSSNLMVKNTCALCEDDDVTCREQCRLQAASDGRRGGQPDGF